MTKTELEKAIKNGESVWYILGNYVYEIDTKKHTEKSLAINGDYLYTDEFGEKRCCQIKLLYKTKAEAEHYLNHANITRIEQLPFLTWEEFLEKKEMYFFGHDRNIYKLSIYEVWIWLDNEEFSEMVDRWFLNEANFYKAYDECVRLFKEDSNVRF